MKILLVDDSRLARKELKGLVREHAAHEIVGEAGDVQSAVDLVNRLEPDLLLLDIHLPDGSGFDVLDKAGFTPKVIFTTAYEQHALHAFEVNALDYLLKPISAERLAQALQKIGDHDRAADVRDPGAPGRRAEHLFIRDGERCHFVKLHDIRLLEVDGNYVRVFFGDSKALLARSLQYVEKNLDRARFFRANRQQIVNLDCIARIDPWIGDGLLITLTDGRQVEASRRQARELKQRLEI